MRPPGRPINTGVEATSRTESESTESHPAHRHATPRPLARTAQPNPTTLAHTKQRQDVDDQENPLRHDGSRRRELRDLLGMEVAPK